jgi:thioredoxin reductase (NADPH)
VNKPVMLVVDDDPQVLAAVRRDLRSKYKDEYTIMGASSGEEAVTTIRDLKARGDSLAIVITDQRMPGIQGGEVLTRTLELYPVARRVLLTAYSDVKAAVTAINEAHVHHYLQKPWAPPEDRLFPVVDDLLDSWKADYLPEVSGIRLVGHQWSPRSHQIKDFLSSNLIPYRWLEMLLNADAAKTLLESKDVGTHELPALFLEDGSVLRDPEPRQVAESLGRPLSSSWDLCDLVIVGAGPAGLAGAVYGASEGLKTLLLDRHSPGGQAGSSSLIENYLGFPKGVSGSELTRRAVSQAERLGAQFLVPIEVCGVTVDAGYKRVALSDGREIVTRTLVVATGMAYREHPADGIAEFTGAGVYYGAATTEAPAFKDKKVYVIGGGNSAGQAAMYLSRYASHVHIVIRGRLLETMSTYLVDQIGKTENIRLRSSTELVRVEGDGHVQRVTLRSVTEGREVIEDADADAVFVFIGTRPRSEWLPASVLRDQKGFVLTGRELMADRHFKTAWKEPRSPLPLETSTPGIFAAGDVRAAAINRVAAAVGEGSMVVRFVHEYLAMN